MDNEFKTVGVQFFFKDTKDPISFGSKGDRNSAVSFDESPFIGYISPKVEKGEEEKEYTTFEFMADGKENKYIRVCVGEIRIFSKYA